MSELDPLERLISAYPASGTTLRRIRDLQARARGIPTKSFLEPPVHIQLENGKSTIAVLEPDVLLSWTRHIADSTIVRMRSLEGGIVAEFANSNQLCGMVLLRAHLETAAMAAHCLQSLVRSARVDDTSVLSELIPKTLFGTALRKPAKQQEWLADFLAFSQQGTIRIASAIQDLDTHLFQETADGQISVLYALLCEYAHPNLGGTRHFAETREAVGGWRVTYRETEPIEPETIKHAIETLLLSIRGGHSASQLLRAWQFAGDGHKIEWIWPTDADVARVWNTILRPADRV